MNRQDGWMDRLNIQRLDAERAAEGEEAIFMLL